MPSVYVASSLYNAERAKEFVEIFRNNDILITHDWTEHGRITDEEQYRKYGELELYGVLDADLLFFVHPGRSGAHVELGAMLAMVHMGHQKTIVMLDESDSTEQKTFYHLESVNRFTNAPAAIEFALRRLKNDSNE